jgi:ribosome maturation factor RimP
MDQRIIEHHLEGILAGMDIFLVGVKVDNNNKIVVHIDTPEGVSIDQCVQVSRQLEDKLDRDREDFALEVSSPGLDAPFRVFEQYRKHVGKDIIVVRTDGDRLEGTLKGTDENGIVLEVGERKGGQSKLTSFVEISFSEIKSARASIKFQRTNK